MIGDRQGIVEIGGFDDREHRSEDFFLGDSALRIDVAENYRTDEESLAGSGHFQGTARFYFSHLNILQNARFGFGIDQRPDGIARIFRRTDLQAFRRFDETR